MDVDMAGEAAWKLFIECLVVRLAVTVGTLRHIAMLVLVAGDAGQCMVLAGALRQFVQDWGMTGAAGARRHILGEGDLQRLMNLVACEAVRHCLSGDMRFVTGEAGRFKAVRRVARHTGNL